MIITASCMAQKFNAEASLPKVEKDGFYRIQLDPSLSFFLNSELSNLRILDSKDDEVPYLLETQQPKIIQAVFKEYEIAERSTVKKFSRIVLMNESQSTISNISLIVKNAEVTKRCSLTGSDDGSQWFALKQDFTLSNINNAGSTSELKIVDFPLSNYKYYAIEINDKRSAPLNILRAGYYDYEHVNSEYLPVPLSKLHQVENSKEQTSIVTLVFDTARFVDKLEWFIISDPFYLRNARLYEVKERKNKKGENERYHEYLANVEFKTGGPNNLQLPGIKVTELLLQIENNDNPPLKFDTVNAFQLNRFATAWLKKDQAYSLKFGEENLRAPEYDIKYFRDRADSTAVIRAGEINLLKDSPEVVKPGFFEDRKIIWGAIVFIIVFLSFMTIRMVRETGAAKKA
jgi:hypothetical protein